MERKTLSTNSGMWAIWNYESYKNITDYDAWAENFEEDDDIKAQIERDALVPININSDGAFEFEVKNGEELNEREKKYLLVSSKNYMIRSEGKLVLSGIEYIDEKLKDSQCIIMETEKGEFSVKINLIDWKKEPGATDINGNPTENALPDFIVQINLIQNSNSEEVFSKSLKTF